jgi:4,5-dihydroxyphthalate decarboxylase
MAIANVPLSLAISRYDHVEDLVTGRVPVEGVTLTPLTLQVEEIFYRSINHREFDVGEMSFAKFAAISAGETPDIIGLPVFPSRVFRQSGLFVRADSPLTDPRELAGKRVGVPEWAQTAQVWMRGWLAHQLGVPLASIEWVQAGVNEPGRKEKVGLRLPEGVRLAPRPDASLSELLRRGEIDAIGTAHPPEVFERGEPWIRRLIPDAYAAERDYFRSTGLFPIMHVVTLRRSLYERSPWLAVNLCTAFSQALANALDRLKEKTASRIPLPWSRELAEAARQDFGRDPFVYGVEANRRDLEAFFGYCHEQGITPRRLAAEEPFARETLAGFKI